jgi:hypothetical protein
MYEVRATMSALLSRQRELDEIEAMSGLTTEQVRERHENDYQLLTLARKLS